MREKDPPEAACGASKSHTTSCSQASGHKKGRWPTEEGSRKTVGRQAQHKHARAEARRLAHRRKGHSYAQLLNPHLRRHLNADGVGLQPLLVTDLFNIADLLCPTVAANGHECIIDPHRVHVASCWGATQGDPSRGTLEEQHKHRATSSLLKHRATGSLWCGSKLCITGATVPSVLSSKQASGTTSCLMYSVLPSPLGPSMTRICSTRVWLHVVRQPSINHREDAERAAVCRIVRPLLSTWSCSSSVSGPR